jgi:phosphoserine phosphatase
MPIKVVFLDCDGTLTKVRSSWEYLHRRLNLWTENADAYQTMFREGKIDYNEFCRRDAQLWKGLSVSTVCGLTSEIPYQENAAWAVDALKKMGVYTVIISSGLSFLVDRIKEALAIDMAFSNELISQAGLLTGDIKINVEYDQKGILVDQVLGALGLKKEESSAVGDGDGDRGMFDGVALPISLGDTAGSAYCFGRVVPARGFQDVVRFIEKHA